MHTACPCRPKLPSHRPGAASGARPLPLQPTKKKKQELPAAVIRARQAGPHKQRPRPPGSASCPAPRWPSPPPQAHSTTPGPAHPQAGRQRPVGGQGAGDLVAVEVQVLWQPGAQGVHNTCPLSVPSLNSSLPSHRLGAASTVRPLSLRPLPKKLQKKHISALHSHMTRPSWRKLCSCAAPRQQCHGLLGRSTMQSYTCTAALPT